MFDVSFLSIDNRLDMCLMAVLCCAHVDIVHLVGLQPSFSDNVAATVTVKSPVERMQSYFSCAHESRWSLAFVSALSVVCIIQIFTGAEINTEKFCPKVV